MTDKRHCRFCKDLFEPTHDDQVYCRPAHGRAFRNRKRLIAKIRADRQSRRALNGDQS